MSEEDPVWLKAKGDDFLRGGDLHSALNAYAAALDADPRMLACLANRSVCLLRLGQPAQCKADCTAALQIIAEEAAEMGFATAAASGSTGGTGGASAAGGAAGGVSSVHDLGKHGGMLVKLLLRRGAAACQLGLFTEALVDYHTASAKYMHLNGTQASAISGVSIESLAADTQRLKLLVDAETLKKEGDSLFAERTTAAALLKYNAALQLVPVHVSCLSNRSACRLALQDLAGCVADCSTAIALLQSDAEGKLVDPNVGNSLVKAVRFAGAADSTSGANSVLQGDQLKTMLFTVLPPAGSEKRTTWLVKTLLRRGVALSQMLRLAEAVEDYSRAAALDPTNEAIRADLAKISAMRDETAAAEVDSIASEVVQ